MNNNFDEINRNDEPVENTENNTEYAAEDIPSVTYDYSESDTPADGTYSMKGEDLVKDDLAPTAPEYSTVIADGDGSINYAPAEDTATQKEKKTKKQKQK